MLTTAKTTSACQHGMCLGESALLRTGEELSAQEQHWGMHTSSLSSVMVLRTVAMDRELMYTLSPHLNAPLLDHTAVLPLHYHDEGAHLS